MISAIPRINCCERLSYCHAIGGNMFVWTIVSGAAAILIAVLDVIFGAIFDFIFIRSLIPGGILTGYVVLGSILGIAAIFRKSKCTYRLYNYLKCLLIVIAVVSLFSLLFFSDQYCDAKQDVLMTRDDFKENKKSCTFYRKLNILISCFSLICYWLITFIVSHVYFINFDGA